MSAQHLDELDLEAHRRVLAGLAGNDCELRLDTLGGELLVSTCPQAQAPARGFAPIVDGDEAQAARAIVHARTESERVALRYRLQCLPGGEDAWLSLVLDASASPVLETAFEGIARLIEATCVRLDVLNGMSAELATRYEELNLVYEIDSHSGTTHTTERAAVGELVEKARAHLRVDLALVYLPEHDLFLEFSACEHGYSMRELRAVACELLARLQDDSATLVINRDRVFDWTGSDRLPEFRLCTAPVRLDGVTPAGLVLFAKQLDDAQFSNSDRRMCEVVATEVVKVMQHTRDPLTGALNRRGLEGLLEETIASPDWVATHALMLIDIDRFQMVNTQLGIDGADELLRQFAQVLPRLDATANVRLARIAADEFALLVSVPDLPDIEAFGERVRSSVKQLAFFHQGNALEITVSIGAAIIDNWVPDAAMAFRVADTSLREAKAAGGNAVVVHAANDAAVGLQRQEVDMVGVLKRAMRDGRMELHGQAITAIADDHKEPYFEVLVRLRDAEGALVPPGRFIPVAERFNLMPEIDRWIIEHTINLMGRHLRAGGKPFRAAVNMSGQSLCAPGIAETILSWLSRHRVPPRLLTVEVTETAAISNLTSGLEILHALRNAGCRTALDDFGSGMSSFGYLRNLPVDVVKIDGAFVSKMTSNAFDRTFVDVINRLAHALGLQTVAEFVEDRATWCMLRDLHIDYVQGYLIDKPGPLEDKLAALAHGETDVVAHAG